MDYCRCRKTGISPQEISVQCSVCQSIHKPDCANLSYSEAYKVSYNIGLFWSCKNCFSSSNDINILKRENLLLHAELKAALTQLCTKSTRKDDTRKLSRSTKLTDDGYQVKNGQLDKSGILEQLLAVPTSQSRTQPQQDDIRTLSDITGIIGDEYDETNRQFHILRALVAEEADGKTGLLKQSNEYDPVQPLTSRQKPPTRIRVATPEFDRNQKPLDTNSLVDSLTEFLTDSLTAQGKEWECILCTFLNSSEDFICSVCYNPRPTLTQTTKTVSQCWNCTSCGSLNRSVAIICFVCLKPHVVDTTTASVSKITATETKPLHFSLLQLDDEDLVPNSEAFECAICFTEVEPEQGAILQDCLHQFCKQCLADAVEHSNAAEIKCPYRDDHYSCDSFLRDREIKALVKAEVYEQHVARSITEAEKKIQNGFHCKTPNCIGWCIYEDNVNTFQCPTCTKENCLTCRAIHEGMNCKQYQDKVRMDAERDQNAKKTEEAIKKLIEIGEAMNCPGCKVVIMRKYGCDWLQCTACKMEICWVTKGPRWGSRGKGDTSGGCKCGVNGIRCHPQCNYCH